MKDIIDMDCHLCNESMDLITVQESYDENEPHSTIRKNYLCYKCLSYYVEVWINGDMVSSISGNIKHNGKAQ